MSTLFSTFGGKIYEIENVSECTDTLVSNPSLSVACREDTSRHLVEEVIKLNTNVNSILSNTDAYTAFKTMITNEKIKTIDKLASLYRLACEYQLVNSKTHEVIDEGTTYKRLTGLPSIQYCGMDSITNEIRCKFVNQFNGSASLIYKDSLPFGVSDCNTEDYILYVTRIQLQEAYSTIEDDTDGSSTSLIASSNSTVTTSPFENYVVVYDSVVAKHEINPITIKSSIKHIGITVSLICDNYCMVENSSEIYNMIAANNVVPTTETTNN